MYAVFMWAKRFWGIVAGCIMLMAYIVIEENKYDAGRDLPVMKTYEKIVAITFDDGPSGMYTEQLLDGLKQRGVKATFFLIGENIEGREKIVKRMYEEGHIIGNHTYSHVELTKMEYGECQAEIERTNVLIESITGQRVKYIRPPCGTWDEKLLYDINMEPVFWDIDPVDWNTRDVFAMVEKVVSSVRDRDIILFHDIYDTSVTAALEVIDRLKSMGYVFVTVEDIIIE